MTTEGLKGIADKAKEAVKHLEEPYKSIAFKEFLRHMLLPERPPQMIAPVTADRGRSTHEIPKSLSELLDEKNPQSHPDIVMVFAHYLFKSGLESFTIDDIVNCYSQVMIPRSKNPSDIINTNIRKHFIDKDDTKKGEKQRYLINMKGLEYVESFKTGARMAKSSKKEDGSKTGKKSTSPPKIIVPLEFNLKGADDSMPLRDFYAEKNPTNHQERLVTYVYYIIEHAGVESVNEGHIAYAYKATKQKRPIHMHQLVLDTKNGPGWVTYDKKAKAIRLTSIGEDFVEFDLPRKEDQSS